MLVPTVTIKNRKTGQRLVINETDWAMGSLPGISIGSDWDRIGETQGTDAGAEAAIESRAVAEKQEKIGAALDAKSKKG